MKSKEGRERITSVMEGKGRVAVLQAHKQVVAAIARQAVETHMPSQVVVDYQQQQFLVTVYDQVQLRIVLDETFQLFHNGIPHLEHFFPRVKEQLVGIGLPVLLHYFSGQSYLEVGLLL